jgi:hypothetical protein
VALVLTVLFSVVLPKALTPSPILTTSVGEDFIQVTRTGFGGLTALPSLGALTGGTIPVWCGSY